MPCFSRPRKATRRRGPRVHTGQPKGTQEWAAATELDSDTWARSKKLKPESGKRKAKTRGVMKQGRKK